MAPYLTLLAHSPYLADTPYQDIPLPLRYWAIFHGTCLFYPPCPLGATTLCLLRLRGIPILWAPCDYLEG